ATLLLRDGTSGDAVYLSFVRAARLRPGQPIDVNLIDLAARCGCTPDEIERRLLRWHDQGLLRYEGVARDVLLELRPAGAGVSGQIEALLAEYRARQDARVEAIAGYARGVTCRHRAIAAHFGERLAPCGDACDICAPGGCATEEQGRRTASSKHRSSLVPSLHSGQAIRRSQASSATPRPSSPAQIGQIIVRCLTQLPFPVGKSGLSKILKGAAGSPIGPARCAEYAALSHLTGAAIEAAIERLVEQGTLRRSSGARPLLALADRSEDRLPANMVQ
ncbi:MAG TPA: RecQ family zinc-binding domain-containing protein, partial [Roseiflexaceae bacterium]